MIGWILGLIGVGGVAALLFVPGLFAAVSTFAIGVFNALMRISIPLLLVMVGVALLAVPTMLNIAGLKRDLRKSEAMTVRVTGERDLARSDLLACQTTRRNLDAALNQQNALVEQLGEERDAAIARGNAAIRKANELSRKYRGKIARLEKSRPGLDQCASARQIIVETLGADR